MGGIIFENVRIFDGSQMRPGTGVVRVEGGRRFHGPQPHGNRAPDGSSLGLNTALTMQRFGSDGFATFWSPPPNGTTRWRSSRMAPAIKRTTRSIS